MFTLDCWRCLCFINIFVVVLYQFASFNGWVGEWVLLLMSLFLAKYLFNLSKSLLIFLFLVWIIRNLFENPFRLHSRWHIFVPIFSDLRVVCNAFIFSFNYERLQTHLTWYTVLRSLFSIYFFFEFYFTVLPFQFI